MVPAMMIRSCSFGSITIDERAYSSDVIVYQDRVDADWWRAEGHVLSAEDLAGPVAAAPEVIVVGTGYFGVMKVPEETRRAMAARGIKLIIERTPRAVAAFNELREQGRKVVAALHLTC